MIKVSTSIENQNQLCVHNQKHCLVLTTQKIGTQFLNHFFNDDSSTNFKLTKNEKKWSVDFEGISNPATEYSEKIENHRLGLKSFLNGKVNKDVIILIRDPWTRFKSALHEDFIKIFTRSQNRNHIKLLGTYILNSKNNVKKLDNWVVNDYMDEIDSWNDNTSNEFRECLIEIYKGLIDSWWLSNYSIQDGHNRPYHELICNIVLTTPNKKNIKIFDIDRVDINDILTKYSVGIKNIEYKNSGGIGKEIINQLLDNSVEYKDMKSQILKMLHQETQSYLSLLQISKLKND